MRKIDFLKLVLKEITHRKFTSFLTLMGISLGIFFNFYGVRFWL